MAGTLADIAVALPLGASAVAIACTHVFPVWMAWLAGLAALAKVLAACAIPSTQSVLVPGSTLVSYVRVLGGLWILAASWLLIREHLPAISAPTTHAVGHA